MGFFDDNASGGGPPLLKFDGKAGQFLQKGSDTPLNGEVFVAYLLSSAAGYLNFPGGDRPPERRMGSIFPEDKAPSRAELGDTDESKWPKGRFSNGEPEDPWRACIEIPMQHKESGEEYTFTAMSKTALAAAKDLLAQARRLPDGFDPVIRLNVGSYKSRFGVVKKPVLSIVGKVTRNAGEDALPYNDQLQF